MREINIKKVDEYHDLKNRLENSCRKVYTNEYFAKEYPDVLLKSRIKALTLIQQMKEILMEIENFIKE